MENTISRPFTSVRLNKRALVWYWREQGAWDLANAHGTVTEETLEKATSLYKRVTRFGCNYSRWIEEDNDARNFKNGIPRPYHKRKTDALMRRMDRLNAELREFANGEISIPWITPSDIVNADTGARIAGLYYFD